MGNFLLRDLIENENHIKARDGTGFFPWLQECPQVMLSSFDWGHHASSGISRHVRDNQSKKLLNKSLDRLWKWYNPIELYTFFKKPIHKYDQLKEFCRDYSHFIEKNNIQENIKYVMEELEQYKFKPNTNLTWNHCHQAAKECGKCYANYILDWMKADENKMLTHHD